MGLTVYINMQNDEEVTLDVQEEEQADTVEVEEAEESTEDTTVETEEDALAKAQAEAAKYRRLFEKSQKKTAPEQTKPQATPTNVEEVVLLANGMDESLMEQLKKIAAVNGTGLIKAQNDPIFVAVKEKFEKDKKSAAASLPASRGAGTARVKKDVSSPGLSREEHMKLAMEKLQ